MSSERPTVVLVPGIFCHLSIFRRLRRELEADGRRVVTVRLTPLTGAARLETLAQQLAATIDREVPKDAVIDVVGFSMGGLISRWYLQELGGHARCRSLTTLSTPHAGTLVAYLWPLAGARQMQPGSRFLQQLRTTETRLDAVDRFAFWTPFDLMIVPARSSRWRAERSTRVPVLLHRNMPTDSRVRTALCSRLRALDTEPSGASLA
jgi:triacylglycerol lipase